jgi:alpha-tubulin suppressor-like RCC1 family protein
MKTFLAYAILPLFIFAFSQFNFSQDHFKDRSYFKFLVPNTVSHKFIQIAAGGSFSLALRDDSTVWAWGNNFYGQLGCGNIEESTSPVQVLLPNGIIQIAAGPNHGLALRYDGTVWSWGENSFGQLGDGTNVSNRIPAQIKSLDGIIAVSAGGEYYSINMYNDPNSSTVYGMGTGQYYSPSFTRTSGFSIALKNDGTVWNWGSNSRCNNAAQAEFWIPGQMNSLTDIIAISAGGFHSLALRSDGTVWAWGDNGLAQLGNDSHESNFCDANQVLYLSGIIAISASQDHSIALTKDSTIWTWGDNPQVYNATKKFTYVPKKVEDLNGIISVSAGSNHFMAIDKNACVWTWGMNGSGQLGNGDKQKTQYHPNHPKKYKVSGLENVGFISAGQLYSLALKKNGTIWAWGNNQKGQLGDGTKKEKLIAVPSGLAVPKTVKTEKEKPYPGPVYH